MLFCATLSVEAQTLSVGSKAPELKIKQWTNGELPSNKPYLLEFFHSASTPSVEQLSKLNQIANKHKKDLVVVVLTKNNQDDVTPIIGAGSAFKIALDDNAKTFTNYGVKYVPFSVLISAKGSVLWFGNSNTLTDQAILEYIK